MKWPSSITLIRHGQSAYNELRNLKANDELYRKFKKAFYENPTSIQALSLAEQVKEKFALGVSDYETPLTKAGELQAFMTGKHLRKIAAIPDIILVSPYLRTKRTYELLCEGFSGLKSVKMKTDDRIREQEHGLSLLYNDWRVFQTLHPEQKELHDLLGQYWYPYPQGESVSQVRGRSRDITTTIIREYAGKNVWLITHHLTILSIRANYEGLSPEEFMRLDQEEKPINCGVTIYRGNPLLGESGQGKLELVCYNKCFWDDREIE